MKIAELKQKSHSDLKGLLGELREKLRVLRFELGSSRQKNTREAPMLRRDIARILTLLKETAKPRTPES